MPTTVTANEITAGELKAFQIPKIVETIAVRFMADAMVGTGRTVEVVARHVPRLDPETNQEVFERVWAWRQPNQSDSGRIFNEAILLKFAADRISERSVGELKALVDELAEKCPMGIDDKNFDKLAGRAYTYSALIVRSDIDLDQENAQVTEDLQVLKRNGPMKIQLRSQPAPAKAPTLTFPDLHLEEDPHRRS